MLNNFSLDIINDSQIELPSRVNFRNYLQKDDSNTLRTQQKVTLPIRASEHYSNLTITTKVTNQDLSAKQPLTSENSEVASLRHPIQSDKQAFTNENESELMDTEYIQYASNFGSLPSQLQNSILKSKDETLSVNTLLCEANIQGSIPENKNELEFCNKCFVYTNKCNCPTHCSACHQLKTKESMCLCDKEFVNSLSAKIEKHFEEDELTQEEIENYRRDESSYIPDSDQVNISDIIEGKLDLMDITPPDPGEKVDMDHCSVEQKKIIEELMVAYEDSFASSRYDVGSYTGFVASIDVTPD